MAPKGKQPTRQELEEDEYDDEEDYDDDVEEDEQGGRPEGEGEEDEYVELDLERTLRLELRAQLDAAHGLIKALQKARAHAEDTVKKLRAERDPDAYVCRISFFFLYLCFLTPTSSLF